MATRPFEWMALRQTEGVSHDDKKEYQALLELADVGGIGLRKDEITIRLTTAQPLPDDRRAAELEVLVRARDAAIQQST